MKFKYYIWLLAITFATTLMSCSREWDPGLNFYLENKADLAQIIKLLEAYPNVTHINTNAIGVIDITPDLLKPQDQEILRGMLSNIGLNSIFYNNNVYYFPLESIFHKNKNLSRVLVYSSSLINEEQDCYKSVKKELNGKCITKIDKYWAIKYIWHVLPNY